jgi:predicted nuclease of predicted toxin-antitoxin system
MDVHVRRAITHGIRQRGIDVLTAQDDGAGDMDDADLLRRATVLNRVVFSYDRDFSDLTARWQASGIHFSGVITARRRGLLLRHCLDDLELLCKVFDPNDISDRLVFIPIQ